MCKFVGAGPGRPTTRGSLRGRAWRRVQVDVLGTMALLAADQTRPGVSVDINVSYIGAAKIGAELVATGTVLRAGRSLGYTEVGAPVPQSAPHAVPLRPSSSCGVPVELWLAVNGLRARTRGGVRAAPRGVGARADAAARCSRHPHRRTAQVRITEADTDRLIALGRHTKAFPSAS